MEEERTVSESGWNVPTGGRITDKKWEFQRYVQVIDHYKTVYETKTRQVLDHYDTSTSYRDNGNGTFSESKHQTPVYRTETYQESHQEPVYRQEPVYAWKYYYDIERWFDVKDYQTFGNNQSAYWSDAYVLKEKQRDSERKEQYWTLYDDSSKTKMKYEQWKKLKKGDKITQTRCLFGIVYSQE